MRWGYFEVITSEIILEYSTSVMFFNTIENDGYFSAIWGKAAPVLSINGNQVSRGPEVSWNAVLCTRVHGPTGWT